jgi:hypothetical protein
MLIMSPSWLCEVDHTLAADRHHPRQSGELAGDSDRKLGLLTTFGKIAALTP